MIDDTDRSCFRRLTAWIVIAAMLLPALVACVTKPPEDVRLDALVVDGTRRAGPQETGLALVVRNGQRLDARSGMTLLAGDRVETGPRADAVIRYPSGSELLMRPSSGGRIGSFTELVGEVFVKVKGFFSVDTTFVKAGARGTAYLVRSHAGGAASVVVVEGVVEVASTTGAWSPVRVQAGSMATAHPRAPQPYEASAEELARTREWVERMERLAPPATGVSKTGVVAAVAVGAAIAAILASRNRDSRRDESREAMREDSREGPRDSRRDSPRDGTPSAGPVGRDSAPAAPELGAPGDLSPGSAQSPGPQLNCTRPLSLRWSAVAGARDYVVSLESKATDAARDWRMSPALATAGTSIPAGSAQGLAYLNRWTVRARAGTLGPVSRTFHFRCDFSGVR